MAALVYWGHYVAHDNNRDSMGLTLQLTRNVLNTFVGWKAQVLHDLHESVPYLYDNTVGDGPYNAWIDPILADEWQMMGWNNVSEMTKFGMPGVFTHGTFDTWSPSYLMFIAAMHNGISRLYETFGNGGADTEERTLRPNEYARTWFKQNPPLPKTKWSQRNNNNYEQTGVLTGALTTSPRNNKLFLHNFYLKAKRSIEKPRTEGPAAYVFPADDPRPGAQADLLRMLQDQGCEISRAAAPFTVMMPAKKAPARGGRGGRGGAGTDDDAQPMPPPSPPKSPSPSRAPSPPAATWCAWTSPTAASPIRCSTTSTGRPTIRRRASTTTPAGPSASSATCRWRASPTSRCSTPRWTRVQGPVQAPGGVEGTGGIFLINHNADNALITLRYRFPRRHLRGRRGAVRSRRPQVQPRQSFIVRKVRAGRPGQSRRRTRRAGLRRGRRARREDAPGARRAYRHHAHLAQHAERRLVAAGVRPPEDSLRLHQHADGRRRTPTCASKYDVIVFAPGVRGNPQTIISGMPMYGNPLPWKSQPRSRRTWGRPMRPTTCVPASAGTVSNTCRSSSARAAC